MIKNDFYSQENVGPFEVYNLGDFELEDGGIIPDLKLAYNTHGELNSTKDNVIVIPTWFSGTSKDYETYIGEDRALNPNEYFMFFPVRDCEAEQKLIPNSELKVINSICGHFGHFGGDGADYHNQIDACLNELLALNVVEAV